MIPVLQRYSPINLLEVGASLQSYDDWPALRTGMDPQVHLSRNSVDQPFWSICDDDTVVVTVTGLGRIMMRNSSVNWFDLTPGDHVYVPARTPHRIMPSVAMVQLRYKTAKPSVEAVAWFCERCSHELWRRELDPQAEILQRQWQRAVEAFNADEDQRHCDCGAQHPTVDLGDTRWLTIAAAIARLAIEPGDDDPSGNS